MKDKIISKRYTEAFLGFAKEGIGREAAVGELKSLKIVLHSNPELGNFLINPQFTLPEKKAVVEHTLGAFFSAETLQFLKLLLEKERFELIDGICDYARVTYSRQEALEALLTSSYPLDVKVISELKSKLERKFKRKLNLYLDLDPGLLGGVRVRVGNTLIDGSVRRRLEELKEKLSQVQV